MTKTENNQPDAHSPRKRPDPLEDPDYEIPPDLILELLSRMMRKANQDRSRTNPPAKTEDLPLAE